MRHCATLLAMACGSTIVGVYQFGQQWITEGYGVNPLIAGGYMVLLFIAPIFITALLNSADAISEEEETS